MGRISSLLLLSLVLLAGCRSFRNRERPPFRKVTPPVAFEILRDSPDVLILDLRTREEFLSDTGHIYRARNIPLVRLTERMVEISAFRDDTFLVYCRDGDPCGEEGMAILVSSGFDNAILVEGGIDGWIRYGFRTVLPAPENLPPPG
ncbi:MAG TPA: rhodanese-like domain-containing protein [Thermoanaerobaculia bacterium]|nr:rhodanese-like domain-containing protein [Thermoanaerobaculia bacterium]